MQIEKSCSALEFALDDKKKRISLGHGAFGSVFAATYCHEQVAVKQLIYPGLKVLLPDERDLFLREARTHFSLGHPRIVALRAVVADENVDPPFYGLIMHRMHTSLDARLYRPTPDSIPPSVRRKLTWLHQTACALDVIHRRHYVHGDIKPGNILLSQSDDASVSDFGESLMRRAGTSTLTTHMRSRGTPLYMAPELLVGDKGITSACDMYSFGIMAWEVLSGQKPYACIPDGNMVAMYVHVKQHGSRPDITLLHASVPADVVSLVQALWGATPSERPTAAAAVAILARAQAPDASWAVTSACAGSGGSSASALTDDCVAAAHNAHFDTMASSGLEAGPHELPTPPAQHQQGLHPANIPEDHAGFQSAVLASVDMPASTVVTADVVSALAAPGDTGARAVPVPARATAQPARVASDDSATDLTLPVPADLAPATVAPLTVSHVQQPLFNARTATAEPKHGHAASSSASPFSPAGFARAVAGVAAIDAVFAASTATTAAATASAGVAAAVGVAASVDGTSLAGAVSSAGGAAVAAADGVAVASVDGVAAVRAIVDFDGTAVSTSFAHAAATSAGNAKVHHPRSNVVTVAQIRRDVLCSGINTTSPTDDACRDAVATSPHPGGSVHGTEGSAQADVGCADMTTCLQRDIARLDAIVSSAGASGESWCWETAHEFSAAQFVRPSEPIALGPSDVFAKAHHLPHWVFGSRLHAAALAGDESALQGFVELGDDVNARHRGYTAMDLVTAQHPACIKVLMEAGAQDSDVVGRFWSALRDKEHAIVRVMCELQPSLAHQRDPRLTPPKGIEANSFPLGRAAWNTDELSIGILLAAGADPLAKNRDNECIALEFMKTDHVSPLRALGRVCGTATICNSFTDGDPVLAALRYDSRYLKDMLGVLIEELGCRVTAAARKQASYVRNATTVLRWLEVCDGRDSSAGATDAGGSAPPEADAAVLDRLSTGSRQLKRMALMMSSPAGDAPMTAVSLTDHVPVVDDAMLVSAGSNRTHNLKAADGQARNNTAPLPASPHNLPLASSATFVEEMDALEETLLSAGMMVDHAVTTASLGCSAEGERRLAGAGSAVGPIHSAVCDSSSGPSDDALIANSEALAESNSWLRSIRAVGVQAAAAIGDTRAVEAFSRRAASQRPSRFLVRDVFWQALRDNQHGVVTTMCTAWPELAHQAKPGASLPVVRFEDIPLGQAASNRDGASVAALLATGADPLVKNKYGETLLGRAITVGTVGAVRCLGTAYECAVIRASVPGKDPVLFALRKTPREYLHKMLMVLVMNAGCTVTPAALRHAAGMSLPGSVLDWLQASGAGTGGYSLRGGSTAAAPSGGVKADQVSGRKRKRFEIALGLAMTTEVPAASTDSCSTSPASSDGSLSSAAGLVVAAPLESVESPSSTDLSIGRYYSCISAASAAGVDLPSSSSSATAASEESAPTAGGPPVGLSILVWSQDAMDTRDEIACIAAALEPLGFSAKFRYVWEDIKLSEELDKLKAAAKGNPALLAACSRAWFHYSAHGDVLRGSENTHEARLWGGSDDISLTLSTVKTSLRALLPCSVASPKPCILILDCCRTVGGRKPKLPPAVANPKHMFALSATTLGAEAPVEGSFTLCVAKALREHPHQRWTDVVESLTRQANRVAAATAGAGTMPGEPVVAPEVLFQSLDRILFLCSPAHFAAVVKPSNDITSAVTWSWLVGRAGGY